MRKHARLLTPQTNKETLTFRCSTIRTFRCSTLRERERMRKQARLLTPQTNK